MNAILAIIRRDLHLALRQGGDSLMAVAFFILAAILFPFGIGVETELLTRIGPGIVWVTALLAALLSLDRLFLADYEDGSLDLLALTPAPLELIVLAKVAAHWLTTGLPLLIAAPLVALLYHVPAETVAMLEASLLLGTPTLSLIGALGAALVLGARRGGVLLALLVAPLVVPVLIFGAGAVAETNGNASGALMIEGALLLAALPLAPWAAAAALRQALE